MKKLISWLYTAAVIMAINGLTLLYYSRKINDETVNILGCSISVCAVVIFIVAQHYGEKLLKL